MATFLFDDLIFGPVNSRRFGVSLGVNLLPKNAKWCNFNCIYCECGWSGQFDESDIYPDAETVLTMLKQVLINNNTKNKRIDAITFAGNGEPCIHPEFPRIIDEVIKLRNTYYKSAIIVVLTNSTRLTDESVRSALTKVEMPVLKLDTAIERSFQLINQPLEKITIKEIINNIVSFESKIYIQTLFFKGTFRNVYIDNTSEDELNAYI